MTYPLLLGGVTKRTFKSSYQILKEISQVWDELTDISQANILEMLGGKRNSNVVAALINGFDIADAVVEDSLNASGSALAENETYLESINGKLTQLRSEFEQLSMSVADSEVLKFLIDALTVLTDITGEVVRLDTILPVVAASLSAVIANRNYNQVTNNLTGLVDAMQEVHDAIKADTEGNTVKKITQTVMGKEGNAISGLVSDYENLSRAKRRYIEEKLRATMVTQGFTEEQMKETLTTIGLTKATDAQTKANVGLATSIKRLFLSNPVGWILTAISLIPLLTSAYDALTKSNEELMKDAEDLRKSYDDAFSDMADSLSKVRGYADEFEELARGVDQYGNNISLSADEYERYLEIVQDVTDLTPSLITGYDEEGRAIADKNQLIERSIELLEEERRLQIQNRSAPSNLTTIFRGAIAEYEEAADNTAIPESMRENAWRITPDNRALRDESYEEAVRRYIESVTDIESAGQSLNEYILANAQAVEDGLSDILNTASQDFTDQSGTMWKAMSEEQVADLRAYLQQLIRSANDISSGVSQELQFVAQNVQGYDELTDAQKNFLTTYINQLEITADTTEQEFSRMQSDIIDFTNLVKDSPELTGTITLGATLVNGTDSDGNSLTVREYQRNLQEVLDDISSYDTETQAKIKVGIGIDPETNIPENEINDAIEHAKNLLKDEFDLEIDNMSIEDIVVAYQITAAPNSMTLDELQQRIVEIGTDWNKTVEPWDFTELASGIDEIEGKFNNLINAMANLRSGTKLSTSELAKLALQYPEMLKASDLFTSSSIKNQYALLDATLSSYETEYDALLDTKIAELTATNTLINDQIALEDQKRQKVVEIADMQSNGQLDSIRAYQTVANELKDLEGRNYVTFSEGVLDVNEDMLNKELEQMGSSVEESKPLWSAQGDMIAEGTWDGLNNALKAFPRFASSVATWAKTNFSQVLGNIGTMISKAFRGEGFDPSIITSGLVGLNDIQNNDKVTIETAVEGSYTIDGKSIDEWSSDYEDTINQRVETLQKQLEDNQIIIDNLKRLKDLDLKTIYKDQLNPDTSGMDDASDAVEEYIADIENYREALERLSRIQIERGKLESALENTDDLKEQIKIQNQLMGVYEREMDALTNLNHLRDQTIANGAEALRQLGFVVEYNANTDNFFVQNLEHLNELVADSQGEYETMQEATNALRQETEDLIDSLESLNEENQNGNESWREMASSIDEAKLNIVNDLKEIVTEASEAVDSIQNVYDTLHKAADEYASSGGFITLDTFQEIVDLGPQYMQMLRDENGQLVINEESINKVIIALTRQLALENAMTYVMRLKNALEQDSVESLNQLLHASLEATEAEWGLVYANLALLDLNDSQREAALHNINAIRSLAENAMRGIETGASTTTDELENMKNGLDDILQYVMDMLEDRIQRQIDKLEEMKESYSELIELKKESLEAAKDEEDYQDDIADRIREIADLQARIDALALDDSRDAQAQRAELLEQMNELQEELGDQQREHAIEQQQDSLDEMQEAYEDQKDQEIAALEESISSQEKLYRMA